MSYTSNLHHIVFRTFMGRCTIPEENKRVMLKYIYVMCEKRRWHIVRMNSCRNHIHILVDLPGDVAPGKYVQIVKPAITKAFRQHKLFPDFEGWAEGYASFSIGPNDRDRIEDYIRNQEEHHLHTGIRQEILSLMEESGVAADEYFDQNYPEEEEYYMKR